MLTKEDKKFLTETFATKKGLAVLTKTVATKKELAASIKPLATKKELAVSIEEYKDWTVENFVTRNEFRHEMDEVKSDLKEVKEGIQKVLNAVDKFSGNMADLQQENKMGAITLRRHDIQIHELAAATGTIISD